HQTKDLHTADYTQLYDFLKYNQKEVDELKDKRIAKIQDPLALMANSNNPYASPAPHQDLSPMPNPEDITDPTTAINMALALMAKAFKLNYSTPTNKNQRISSNPRNRQIAQPGMNMGQDRQIKMIRADLDEIEEVNANCILMANLQQASSSGCSKHMTGNLKLLINFVWKFMGTVRFGNDHVAAILGFGDFSREIF
nr:integrase, catalytic region, zinc finger, CCHC-type, peptidase aspartic, catalytic [Tanacetum cinerariifolium]